MKKLLLFLTALVFIAASVAATKSTHSSESKIDDPAEVSATEGYILKHDKI